MKLLELVSKIFRFFYPSDIKFEEDEECTPKKQDSSK